MTCVFCQLPEERILYSNPYAMAVRDAYPVSPGHTLIIPKRHVASFFDVTAEERNAMFALLDRVKHEFSIGQTADVEQIPDAYNIGINDGPAAGQTVPHLHIHLIPRYQDDLVDPRGGVRWVLPGKADYWNERQ